LLTAQKILWALQDKTYLNNEKSLYYNNSDLNFLTTPPQRQTPSKTKTHTVPSDYFLSSSNSPPLPDHCYEISDGYTADIDSWVDATVRNSTTDDDAVVSSLELCRASDSVESNIVQDGLFSGFTITGDTVLKGTDDELKDFEFEEKEHLTLSNGEQISLQDTFDIVGQNASSDLDSSRRSKTAELGMPFRGRLHPSVNRQTTPSSQPSTIACLLDRPPPMRHLSLPHHSPLPRFWRGRASTSPAVPRTVSAASIAAQPEEQSLPGDDEDISLLSVGPGNEFRPEVTSTPTRVSQTVAEVAKLKNLKYVITKSQDFSSESEDLDTSADTVPAVDDKLNLQIDASTTMTPEDTNLKHENCNSKVNKKSTELHSDNLSAVKNISNRGLETLNLNNIVEKLKLRTGIHVDEISSSPVSTKASTTINRFTDNAKNTTIELQGLEPWAKNLSGLWQFQPRQSMDLEKEFNGSRRQIP
jgi:hypothetical protein